MSCPASAIPGSSSEHLPASGRPRGGATCRSRSRCASSSPRRIARSLGVTICISRVLTNPTVPIETMLNRMREVYSTAGIRVDVVSREVLTPAILGNSNFTDLNDLDVEACERGAPSNEQRQLFRNQNRIAPDQRGHEVVVYFVRSVTASRGPGAGAKNGCATHPSGQPGACVGQGASQFTLAHEVGHVLGLKHISGEHMGCPPTTPLCCSTRDRTRLMTDCGTAGIVGVPTVDQGEINTMTNSSVTRPC